VATGFLIKFNLDSFRLSKLLLFNSGVTLVKSSAIKILLFVKNFMTNCMINC